ncbi:MAG: hypothetical protein K2I43_07190, partial [Alistipes sp.]|nr:hypothetical protein [Alistipes sp.]
MEMERKALYDRWVDEVCAFLEEAGPRLNRCCNAMQSRPVLDGSPEVVFLGYNAHEDYDWIPEKGADRRRFYDGNPYFYTEGKTKWAVWSKLYGAMKWAECTRPMEDGRFVFMNAVYFGSASIAQLKAIPGSGEAIAACLRFTERAVTEIFRPKLVVCFSIPELFNPLAAKFGFREVETLHPLNTPKYVSRHAVRRGWWGDSKVIGLPHP